MKNIIEHQFIKSLSMLVRNTIFLNKDHKFSIKKGFVPGKNLSNSENYLRNSLLSCWELCSICNGLHQAVIFLTNYRSTPKLKLEKIDRYDYIIYHLESHLIKTISCYDRCLILVNDVFLLGNTPINCKDAIITTNNRISGTTSIKLLKNK